MKEVRVSEAIGSGWEGLKNNWVMFLALGGIYVGVEIVMSVVQRFLTDVPLVGLVFTLIGMVVNAALYMLLMKFSLQIAAAQGAKVELFSEMEVSGEELGRYFLTYLLLALVIIATMALCMIPVGVLILVNVGLGFFSHSEAGAWKEWLMPLFLSVAIAFVLVFYVGLMVGQALYACLQQGLGPWDSLMESKRLTDGAKGGLFVFTLASMAVVILGLICLLVGALPATAVVLLGHSFVYLSLVEQSGPRSAV